jgi:hypothetical protein
MDSNFKKLSNNLQKELQEVVSNIEKEYQYKVQTFLDDLDLIRLSEIRHKPLDDLTEIDLEFIGFVKIKDDEGEWEHFYSFRDLNGLKKYFVRLPGKFELRGFRLKKEADILTTKELLDSSLLSWKLKYK